MNAQALLALTKLSSYHQSGDKDHFPILHVLA